jgi:NADPH-dependent 2,4-dienoyl-CoA reductase/sulfur reductase-like enzyme
MALWHRGQMTTGEPGTHLPLERVVIIGASLAGLRAAETLRQREFAGEVVVVGSEHHRPYDRPPLSKKLLSGEWEPDRIHLRQPDSFDELDVTWQLGTTATGLDLTRREVRATDDAGTKTLAFDGLIIATGASPKEIGDHAPHAHVHVLRSLDDALRVRAAISGGGKRVVVIGAGFIGLEVAATARQLDNEVIVLEGGPAPLIRGLGAEMGAAIGAMHTVKGIDLRCNVAVDGFTDDGVLIRAIDGASGTVPAQQVLLADVIVVGVGVTPSVGWLEGSGLELRDGIVCDEFLRAVTPIDTRAVVFAAGDVARWTNPLLGHEMRVEHWTNAAEQGAHAASNMLALADGEPMAAYAPIPFFWSDQFEHRIQFLGHAMPDDEVRVVAGSVDEGKFLALYGSEGRLHGALGVNAPRWVMPTRKLLMEKMSWEEAIIAAVPPT